jgi:hypothetical protein
MLNYTFCDLQLSVRLDEAAQHQSEAERKIHETHRKHLQDLAQQHHTELQRLADEHEEALRWLEEKHRHDGSLREDKYVHLLHR